MLRKSLHSIALMLGLALMLGSTAAAEIDGPDTYVYAEVSVREATVEGMRERLALLQSGEYSAEADSAIDERTRMRVVDAYALFGTSASAHAAYGTRHAAAIEQWLHANPAWKSRLTALDTQFRALSDQLSAARRTS